MSQLSSGRRRPVRSLRLGLVLSALALVAMACSSDADDTADDAVDDPTTTSVDEATAGAASSPDEVPLPDGAAYEVAEIGDVTVHTYVGVGAINGTYVVESENAVVVIDTQFTESDATTLRAIADATGKPIDHVFITHDHPDHIGGLDVAFADVPVATTAAVADNIGGADTILDGSITIDGIDWTITEILGAEAEAQMVAAIDGGVFVGDLVYHDTHLVVSPEIEGWIDALGTLEATFDDEIVHPGHGGPAGPEVYAENVAYLEVVRDILPTIDDVESYRSALFAAYPGLPGEFFTDFYAEPLIAARGGEAAVEASEDEQAAEVTDLVEATAVDLGRAELYPESVAVVDGVAYVSAFFTGEIVSVDLASGEVTTLAEAGAAGVTQGWGLFWESATSSLLACGNGGAFGAPNPDPNTVVRLDPADGSVLDQWVLPAGALCNSVVSIDGGDVYVTDVSPAADVIRIDRASGTAEVWLDEPTWENDSGFGLGGLAVDEAAGVLYVSPLTSPVVVAPVDGSASTPLTYVDAGGAPSAVGSFDGLAFADGVLVGAGADPETGDSRVFTIELGDDAEAVVTPVFGDAVSATGVAVADGEVAAVDGQLTNRLFDPAYVAESFRLFRFDLP